MKQQFSYSRVECFNKCPYQFGLRYLEKYKTLSNQDANNALVLGVSLHYGLETGSVQKAVDLYKNHYYSLSDLHIEEIIKLESMIPKALEVFERMGQVKHEVEINSDRYKGFVDLVEFNQDGTVNIYDYKYCSEKSVDRYLESGQLHVYKYYLEKVYGWKVKSLYYIIIPKTNIRQKKTENLYEFRQRLKEELKHKEVQLIEVPYNSNKVADYFNNIIDIYECENFVKNSTRLCDWCEYKDYCQKGEDYMLLPSVERREITGAKKRRIWCYAPPFSGKTTVFDKAPNPLMLNTDGNIDNVTAPYLSIKDQVAMNGRIKNVKFAWEYYKEIIEELEKGQNDFKTLIVDLMEDTYEHCRIWGCKELGIDHESDNSFKAYDYVRSEFLRTMNKLMNLDYENIIILSHEDISKDIMKKSGDKVTRIAPNINEKIANKVAGMVGLVTRIEIENDKRFFTFKYDDVIFGGGRLGNLNSTKIPLDWNELVKLYDIKSTGSVVEEAAEEVSKEESSGRRSRRTAAEQPKEEVTQPSEDNNQVEEVPAPSEKVEEVQEDTNVKDTPVEEVPKQEETSQEQSQTTRRRRRRSAE